MGGTIIWDSTERIIPRRKGRVGGYNLPYTVTVQITAKLTNTRVWRVIYTRVTSRHGSVNSLPTNEGGSIRLWYVQFECCELVVPYAHMHTIGSFNRAPVDRRAVDRRAAVTVQHLRCCELICTIRTHAYLSSTGAVSTERFDRRAVNRDCSAAEMVCIIWDSTERMSRGFGHPSNRPKNHPARQDTHYVSTVCLPHLEEGRGGVGGTIFHRHGSVNSLPTNEGGREGA